MEERDGVRRRVVGKRKRREWNTGKQGRTEEGKNGGRTGERIGERRIRTMPIFKSDLPIGIRKAAISLTPDRSNTTLIKALQPWQSFIT
jgi:hypothetical protein